MLQRNLKLFKLYSFFNGFWPLSAVAVIYFQTITNSYTLAMLVFSISSLLQAILEVPTGIFSDRIGRKNTLLIGTFSLNISYLIWFMAGIYNSTELLFIGALFRGLSIAMSSGTDDAFVFETMKDIGQTDKYDETYSINKSFEQLGLAISAGVAIFVTFFFPLIYLAALGLIPSTICFFVLCFMLLLKEQTQKLNLGNT